MSKRGWVSFILFQSNVQELFVREWIQKNRSPSETSLNKSSVTKLETVQSVQIYTRIIAYNSYIYFVLSLLNITVYTKTHETYWVHVFICWKTKSALSGKYQNLMIWNLLNCFSVLLLLWVHTQSYAGYTETPTYWATTASDCSDFQRLYSCWL